MIKCYYCDKEAKYKSTIKVYPEDKDDIEYVVIDVCEEHKIKDILQELKEKASLDEITIELKDEVYKINLNFANFINIYHREHSFIMRIAFEHCIVKIWYYDLNLEPQKVEVVYLGQD